MMEKQKIERSYSPKKGFSFFYNDYDGDGMVYFKTEQDRDAAAEEAVQNYLHDGWSEEVENIVVGTVTGASTRVDVEIRPEDDELDEDNCDEDGSYWDSDWDYKCNYKIKPLGFVCPTNKPLKRVA